MESILETCCGSPAYAAPELVSGQRYLGAEADVWSMGVLLYALLCGFLPFDDENIGTLYRKIQDGIYEKPSWLSEGSLIIMKKVAGSYIHTLHSLNKGNFLQLCVYALKHKFLLLQMLQVDAKKRITIRELLRDPWMMDGYDVPVKWQSKYHASEVDQGVINEMAAYKLISPARMSDCIRR